MLKRSAYIKIIAVIAAVLSVMQIAVFADEAQSSFFVLDEAEVISEELEADIIEKGEVILAQSGCRFAVVAVDFLGGKDIAEFSRELYIENEMGNNGVLLIFSVAEENYHVIQGEKIKSKLSDTELKEIFDKYVEQPFESMEYNTAIEAAHREITEKLENIFSISSDKEKYELKLKEIELANEKTAKMKNTYSMILAASVIVAVLFFIIMVVSFCCRAKRRKK